MLARKSHGRVRTEQVNICSVRSPKVAECTRKFGDKLAQEPWATDLGEPPLGSALTALSYHSKGSETQASLTTHALTETWRITDDGIQWVLERRKGEQWRGRSWCRNKSSLERCIREHAGLRIELGLPEFHPSIAKEATKRKHDE